MLACITAAIIMGLMQGEDSVLHHRFVSNVKANTYSWSSYLVEKTGFADTVNAPRSGSYYLQGEFKPSAAHPIFNTVFSFFTQPKGHLSKISKITMLTRSGRVIDLCRYTGFCRYAPDVQASFAGLPGTQRPYFEAALKSGQMQVVLNSSQENWQTTTYVPLFKNGTIAGVARIESTVSDAGRILIVSASEATRIMSIIVAIMMALAALLGWKRLRGHLKIQQEARFLAHHDPLTGLPNRASLMRKLEDIAVTTRPDNETITYLLLIDLDRFKEINDTLGHPTGDALISAMARRLSMIIKKRGFVARLGGDEFAIVISFDSPIHDVAALGQHIVERFEQPFAANGHQIVSTASVGIARANQDAKEPDRLLRNADLALYRAKQDGRSTSRLFTPEMKAELERRRDTEAGLRKAIESDSLEVWYQSQHALSSGETVGYEALIRWTDPVRGPQSPAEFISVAEDTGLIGPIGSYVLHKACRDALKLPGNATISVNLSPAQFRRQDVVKEVRSALRQSGLPAERLEVEITERVFLSEAEEHIRVLKSLKEMGVKIALDDFGTGYSSLSYLASFQFDKVKIDRSFINQLGHSRTVDAIVSSIVGLGHALDMTIVAEGVETSDHVTLLQAAGCTLGQGWYYAKARSLTEITADPDIHRGKLRVASNA